MFTIFSRIKDRFYAKFVTGSNEKEYVAENGVSVDYLFFENKKSDALIIGFQAANGTTDRYNYVGTLADENASRLFIKDKYGQYGDFYLGYNGKFDQEAAVLSLIDKVKRKTNAKKLIFIGSSKGGYAAINFGIRYPCSSMIVAAPQYYVADYMTELKKFNQALEDAAGGDLTEERYRQINTRLKKKILESSDIRTQTFYIHCSVNEIMYEKHVRDLISDLDSKGAVVVFDRAEYEEHNDLRYYFPAFLKQSVETAIKEK